MNRYRALFIIITVIVIVGVTACEPQGNRPSALPTVAVLPSASATDTPVPTATATFTPSITPTITPSATITDTPIGALPVTPFPDAGAPPLSTGEVGRGSATNTPPAVPFPPTLTPTSLPAAFIFGKSAQGKDLTAYRFGAGSRHIMLIGGVHTGYETNTVGLVRELRTHFEAASGEIPPNVALILVPALNPDGLNYGEQLRGRFNANEVDLNRNWGCGWSPTAVFRDNPVSPGSQPFSEPEVQALGALIQQVNPYAVLFYHSAARGVFPGNCERHVSDGLAQVYADASGYPFQSDFGDYTVTGSASGWVDSYGIPSVDVELATASDTEFWNNLRGVQAVMAWVAGMP